MGNKNIAPKKARFNMPITTKQRMISFRTLLLISVCSLTLISLVAYYIPTTLDLIMLGYNNSVCIEQQKLILSNNCVWEDSENGYLLEVHEANANNGSRMTLTHSDKGMKVAVQFDLPGTIKFMDYDSKHYNDYNIDRLHVVLYADWEYDVKNCIFSIFITDVVDVKYSYLKNTTLTFHKSTLK